MNRAFALFLSVLFTLFLSVSSPAFSSQNYYVSNVGNDFTNSGTTPDSPWKSISKINSFSPQLLPGDGVYFNRGGIWRETLTPITSGTPDLPITFGAYGEGVNPLFTRTDIYDEWWEHSLISNGSMASYVAGLQKDDWDGFSENAIGGACSVKADSEVKHSGSASARMTCDGNGQAFGSGNYTKLTSWINPLADNTTYFLSIWGRVGVAGDNALVLRVRTVCNGVGKDLDAGGVWQASNGGAAATWNGVPVNTWTQKTITFTTGVCAVGTPTYEISLYNFQTGSSWIDGLYLVQGSAPSQVKVWAGYNSGILNSRGAMRNGVRVEQHYRGVQIDPLTINDGYFYAPQNRGYFYLRDDSGYPSQVEVGARARALYVLSQSNLLIENLHTTGPAANEAAGWLHQSTIGIEGASSNIIVRDVEISNGNAVGIMSENTTTNITYTRLHAHDNGNTGIYLNSQGGKVENSSSHDNGRLASDGDTGDFGGIGSYQGGNLTITGNETYRNGQDNNRADFEISVVGAVNPMTIKNNYMHDCIQGCLQLAEGGDGSLIAYNVISGFGSTTKADTVSSGSWGGIRVGGGTGGAQNVKIVNNVIQGGQQPITSTHAGIVVRNFNNSGLVIKNNIFYDNRSKDIYVQEGSITTGSDFSNNLYYKSVFSDNWYWKGANASSLSQWKTDSQMDNASLDVDPMFVDAASRNFHLVTNSPAVNTGVSVGLSQDREGNAIAGYPDIGAYEVPGVDLSVETTYSSSAAVVGVPLKITVTVTNNGPGEASDVGIGDYLSGDLDGALLSSSQGTCSGEVNAIFNCFFGSIASGASASLEITLTPISEGEIVNSAWSSLPVNVDTNSSNNSSFTSISVQAPSTDLFVAILSDPTQTIVNSQVNYVVTVINAGPSTATGVTLTGLSGCTLATTTLASGASTSCSVTVAATAVGALTQTVSVSGIEVDSNIANNSATVTTTVTQALQNITVSTAAPTSVAYGGTFAVDASASSGLSVAVTVTGGCSIAGNTITMTSGTTACTVNYNQAGNSNYVAATQVSSTTTATKASQAITVNPAAPSSAGNGSNFTVAATSSSGLSVSISTAGGCTNIGGVVTMTSSTLACTVNYNQAGDSNYMPATQVSSTTTPTTGIDLVPLSTSASRVSSTKVSVTETVKNQGNVNSGKFTIRYYLSTNATYESTDIPLASNSNGTGTCSRTLSSLNKGSSSLVTGKTCYKPSGVSAGVTYNVLVVDDRGATFPGGDIVEYNEANNVSVAGAVAW